MLMLILMVELQIINKVYFNTSHVNVNPAQAELIAQAETNFNTSHVNVNPTNLSLFNHA